VNKLPVYLLISVVVFFSGCDRGQGAKKLDATNDMLMEYIKEDILKNAAGGNIQQGNTASVMEDVYTTNLIADNTKAAPVVTNAPPKQIPVEDEIAMNNQAVPAQALPGKTKENNQKKPGDYTLDEGLLPVEQSVTPPGKQYQPIDQADIIPPAAQQKPQKQVQQQQKPQAQPAASVSGAKGSYIKMGNDSIGQGVSPRDFIKITLAVFTQNKNARYCEFQLYAVPVGQPLKRTGYFLLAIYKYIDVINGQAQLTRYWNGLNVYQQFLPVGKYNIYLYYKVKSANGTILYTDGRYWGNSRDFFIRLF